MAGGSGSGGALLCIEGDQGVRTLLAVERLGGSAKATVNSGCASGRRPNKGAANRVMGASTETTPRPLNWGRRNLEDLRGPIRVDIQDHLALSLTPTHWSSVTEMFGVHPKPMQPHPIDAIGLRCNWVAWDGDPTRDDRVGLRSAAPSVGLSHCLYSRPEEVARLVGHALPGDRDPHVTSVATGASPAFENVGGPHVLRVRYSSRCRPPKYIKGSLSNSIWTPLGSRRYIDSSMPRSGPAYSTPA